MYSTSRPPDAFFLSFLRVAATLAVVVLHTAARCVVPTHEGEWPSSAWWAANIADSLVRWSIPVFVLIAGAIHLDPARAEPPRTFFRKRATRVLVPLVFWSGVYLLADAARGALTAGDVLRRVLHGVPHYHLWFLFMILGLYLFTPALRTYVAASSRQERWWTIGILFVLASAHSALRAAQGGSPTVLTLFVPYLAYYLCGYQLRAADFRMAGAARLAMLVSAGLLLTAAGTWLLVSRVGPPWSLYLYDYLSPPVIVTALAVFAIAAKAEQAGTLAGPALRRLVNGTVPATLGIYLIHPLPMAALGRLFERLGLAPHPAVSIPVVAALTFLASLAAARALLALPGLRRTV